MFFLDKPSKFRKSLQQSRTNKRHAKRNPRSNRRFPNSKLTYSISPRKRMLKLFLKAVSCVATAIATMTWFLCSKFAFDFYTRTWYSSTAFVYVVAALFFFLPLSGLLAAFDVDEINGTPSPVPLPLMNGFLRLLLPTNLPDIDACIRKEDTRHAQLTSQKGKRQTFSNEIKIKWMEITEGKKKDRSEKQKVHTLGK